MGLIGYIHRGLTSSGDTRTVFAGMSAVTLTNVSGPFEPTPDRPAALLAKGPGGGPVIVPDPEWYALHAGIEPAHLKRLMFSGSYVDGDSRLADALKAGWGFSHVGVPVHDYTDDVATLAKVRAATRP